MPLPDKKCLRCNYALPTHGDGLGIPDDYLPCEYCFWRRQVDEITHVLLALLRDKGVGVGDFKQYGQRARDAVNNGWVSEMGIKEISLTQLADGNFHYSETPKRRKK